MCRRFWAAAVLGVFAQLHGWQCEAEVEKFEASESTIALRGSAQIAEGKTGRGLLLPGTSYAEWTPQQLPSLREGSVTMWISPKWPLDTRSHTFLTFRWSGPANSYFALSQGWWEPGGQGKLYAVVSNQDGIGCEMPMRENYVQYLPNEWTFIGVTWQAGSPGTVRLYVDGKLMCQRAIPASAQSTVRTAQAPLLIGSDKASSVAAGRTAEFLVDDIATTNRAMSIEDMRSAYIRGGASERPKWIRALTGNTPQERPHPNETRLMQDEDFTWSRSRSEIRRRVDRVKAAGFNAYMPCVWDGGQSYFKTGKVPNAASIRDVTQPDYDPLQYLIDYAHSQGIEVHAWFYIARRSGDKFPKDYYDGAPEYAFNVHSAGFREFIADLVVDAAQRYDLDGINLDYIRSTGACSNESCVQAYRSKYGRSIADDWALLANSQWVPSLIEFNRTPVTDIVRRISTGVHSARPGIVLSIDSVPFEFSRQHQGVDDAGWIKAGLIDTIVQMSYEDPVDLYAIRSAAAQLGEQRLIVLLRNFDIFGERVERRSGAVMSDYVQLVRTLWPNSGIGFYHYMHFDGGQETGLASGPFRQKASPSWSRARLPLPPDVKVK
jgi:uncharacterized lipoprotein YddW (UPF0748 family)